MVMKPKSRLCMRMLPLHSFRRETPHTNQAVEVSARVRVPVSCHAGGSWQVLCASAGRLHHTGGCPAPDIPHNLKWICQWQQQHYAVHGGFVRAACSSPAAGGFGPVWRLLPSRGSNCCSSQICTQSSYLQLGSHLTRRFLRLQGSIGV